MWDMTLNGIGPVTTSKLDPQLTKGGSKRRDGSVTFKPGFNRVSDPPFK